MKVFSAVGGQRLQAQMKTRPVGQQAGKHLQTTERISSSYFLPDSNTQPLNKQEGLMFYSETVQQISLNGWTLGE